MAELNIPISNAEMKQGARYSRNNPFAGDNVKKIDYKNVQLLKKHTSEKGKIIGARPYNMDAKVQRKISREIKRARFLALMPYSVR